MPVEIVQGALVIRSWDLADAEQLSLAIAESIEHLRPFMPWIAFEPQSVEQRRELIAGWLKAEADGGDLVVGVFLDGRVVGGSGLHTRLGAGGLEIGYWVHRDYTRRGIASSVSAALADHAFARPDIDRVEIHHDVANVASEGVPRALGFRHVGDEPREIKAPAETGVHRIWRITRPEWTAARNT